MSYILVYPNSCHKINTDGLSKGIPSPAACGAAFRDGTGLFLDGYGLYLGTNTSYFAELMAVIVAVEKPTVKGGFRYGLNVILALRFTCYIIAGCIPLSAG